MIGNINGKFELACCVCGIEAGLMQVAHRNRHGLVIGYLFACADCLEEIGGKYTIRLEPPKKEKQ